MGRTTLLNKRRALIGLVFGLLTGLPLSSNSWQDLRGDDPETIKEVSARLDEFAQLHSLRLAPPLGNAGAAAETPATRAKMTEDALNAAADRFLDMDDPVPQKRASWKGVVEASEKLNEGNGRIARGKALKELAENPDPRDHRTREEWVSRHELAGKDFEQYSRSRWIAKVIGVALSAVVLFGGLCWLFLFFLSYSWYFCLDRIREVAVAVRGGDRDL